MPRRTAMFRNLSLCPSAPLEADGRALRVGSVVQDGLQKGSAGREWWDTCISCSLLEGLWQGSRFRICCFSGSAAVAFVICTAYLQIIGFHCHFKCSESWNCSNWCIDGFKH